MKLYQKIKKYNILLATNSPRRQQFFRELQIDFSVKIKPTNESFPSHLKEGEITDFIAQKKAIPFLKELTETDILITSDTLVLLDNQPIGKPKDISEAKNILQKLSGKTHSVITSVCITTLNYQKVFHEVTKVTFKEINSEEIEFYIKNFFPMDKAGAYGIQEWIGLIGITRIEGSYNNVVGLPTHRILQEIESAIDCKSIY